MDSDSIEAFFDKVFSDLPPLYNRIQIHHTARDKVTWKFAHLPNAISRRSNGITHTRMVY
jgi:hypothetical protein